MNYKEKICISCKKRFKPNSGIQTCCSLDCRKEVDHPSKIIKCSICGKKVKTKS